MSVAAKVRLSRSELTAEGKINMASIATTRHNPWTGANLRRVLRRPQFWFGTTMIVPTLVWYFLFAYFPIARGLWLAVVDYDFVSRTNKGFIGLTNFQKLLMDPLLFTAIGNSLKLGVLEFAVTLPLALFLASCIVNVKRGGGFYQAAIFLPVVVSLVAVSLLFLMIMDPQTGQLNQLLGVLGLPPSQWLSSNDTALSTVAAINIWKGMGFSVLLFVAGMLNIPTDMYDAARVDGVNEWQRFTKITLPLLGHTLVLVTVLLAIGALQEYTSVQVLTGGGPGTSTEVLNILIVQQAFSNMRFGVAAAASIVEFVLVFIVSIVQLKLLRPNWSY